MPIYEYQCAKCGTFEITQRITEKQLGRCPTCKGKVKKLISNTSFQLKGTGWYVTDYARKGSGDDSKTESSSKSTESSGDSKKSESKKTESSTKSGGEKSSTASSSAAS
jgi:putative FmdB family regulatory protein